MFLKLIFIFLIILGATGADILKMLKIFGKVSNVSLNSTKVNTNCMSACFNKSDCFLAYFNLQNHCQLFSFNATQTLEVLKTTKAEGFYVAFRTTLPNNTCPAYDRILPVVNIGEDPITWSKSGGTFSFRKCVGNWKMFHRTSSKVTVCMKSLHIPNWCNITAARGFCENMGYKVTGVATVEESKWIWKKVKVLLPGKRYHSFYIDGIRTQNCSLTRCNKFEFSDGYTVIDDAVLSSTNADLSISYNGIPENCLGVAELGNVRTINDVRCDSTNKNVGVVCGYKLY